MCTMKKWLCFFLGILLLMPLTAVCAEESAAYTTEAEVKAAISVMLWEGQTEMELQLSEGLFQSLFRQGRMYRLMNELGYADFTLQGNTLNQVFLSNLQPVTVPYAVVSSVNEAGEKISSWRKQGETAFQLLFDETVYPNLTRDDWRLIAFLGGAEEYSLSYNNTTCMLMFSDVIYTDAATAYCEGEDALVSAIRALGSRGIKDFQIMLDQATYDAVTANSFARLFELEAEAGMTSSDLRYSGGRRLLLFSNAVISSDVQILSTVAEAIAHVEKCADRGEREITMLLAADVYDTLMEGVSDMFASDAKIYDLIANAGILSVKDISFNRHSGAITVRGVQYYAGTNILRALRNGNTAALTDREQQALAAAQRLAANCTRETEVDTAQSIHDALCAMITYVDDETTDEDDSCIGALLNGQANCDGYADAMMLTGRLAGLNVRCQHGDSLKGGLGSLFSTHMWNLIELDGTWRMMDVTWDDMESGILYQWFNIGEDRASRSHVWSAEMSVPMLAATEAAGRPVLECFAATADEVTAACAAAQAAGYTVFDIYVSEESGLAQISTREAALKGLSGSVRYVWIDSMLCLHLELAP